MQDYDKTNWEYYETHAVPCNTIEYEQIIDLLVRATPLVSPAKACMNMEINVSRVQNPYLSKMFSMLISGWSINSGDVMRMFHGTSAANVDSICKQGFNRVFSGKNGSNFGKGNYFSKAACYSMDSKYSPPSDLGMKTLILADVIVGKSCDGKLGMTRPEPGCHSAHDPSKNIRVTFTDNQAYPSYVITYRLPVLLQLCKQLLSCTSSDALLILKEFYRDQLDKYADELLKIVFGCVKADFETNAFMTQHSKPVFDVYKMAQLVANMIDYAGAKFVTQSMGPEFARKLDVLGTMTLTATTVKQIWELNIIITAESRILEPTQVPLPMELPVANNDAYAPIPSRLPQANNGKRPYKKSAVTAVIHPGSLSHHPFVEQGKLVKGTCLKMSQYSMPYFATHVPVSIGRANLPAACDYVNQEGVVTAQWPVGTAGDFYFYSLFFLMYNFVYYYHVIN